VRVALIEPYYGGSHQAWADGYAVNSADDVTLITHEARFWKWRMHGAHLTLAADLAAVVDEPPDVVLASSMMSVGAFAGAARQTIGGAPIAVYFHESQFSYPVSPLDRPDLTYPMVNWSSAAIADLVIFNSEYHRVHFFEEGERFLRQFPDRRHARLVGGVAERSIVLPVGVDLRRIGPPRKAGGDGSPLILWNQRWEHDKGPDEFVEMVEALAAESLDFEVAVAGERFVSSPESFDRLPDLLGDRLVAFGFLPDDEYVDLLGRATIVVSTAKHEFFGIAIVEAMAAGAFPVLPNCLVYPDRVPEPFHDPCLYDNAEGFAERVRWAIQNRIEASTIAQQLAETVRHFDWSVVAPQYDQTLHALVAGDLSRALASGRGRRPG